MKTFHLYITILFCVIFMNISNAQTVKQQVTKQNLDSNTNTCISSDVSESAKKSISSSNIENNNQQQSIVDKKSGNIKIITPTTVIINISNEEGDELESDIEYKSKKQSYRLKYNQKRKIIGTTNQERDE